MRIQSLSEVSEALALTGQSPEAHHRAMIAYPGCNNCSHGIIAADLVNSEFTYCQCESGRSLASANQARQTEAASQAKRQAAQRQEKIERRYGAIIPPAFLGITWNDISSHVRNDPERIAQIKDAFTYARDGFLVSDTNRVCYSLLLHGPTGTGKTTIAMRIAQDRLATGTVVMTQVVSHFMRRLGAMEYDEAEKCVLQACEVPFLVLDDLGHVMRQAPETPRRIEILQSIINHRCDFNLPTVVTTNLDRDDIERQFGPAIAGRLRRMCATIKLDGEDIRNS